MTMPDLLDEAVGYRFVESFYVRAVANRRIRWFGNQMRLQQFDRHAHTPTWTNIAWIDSSSPVEITHAVNVVRANYNCSTRMFEEWLARTLRDGLSSVVK